MEEYHTRDCGNKREYNYRNIRSPKIQFRVRAERDVALCLSHHKRKSSDEDTYEIFIGCWGGDESGIRRGKAEDVLRVETKGILSGDEYRSFWIMFSRGVLKVGKKGKSRPFMIFEDPDHLQDLNYYGYCTGWGAEGDWMFDDDREDSSSSSSASSSDSEAEDLSKLRKKPIMYKRPARWVIGTGGHLPHHPVSCGTGDDGDIYVGMAKHEGGHILGMVVQSEQTCYIPYGGESVSKEKYYVLGNPGGVSLDWKPASCGTVPPGALEGGKSEDGEPLFIGRVCVDGVISCGKVHPSHGVIYVPYGGAEHSHRDYEVLCVTGLPCRFRL